MQIKATVDFKTLSSQSGIMDKYTYTYSEELRKYLIKLM
jgi:hypothetical protein